MTGGSVEIELSNPDNVRLFKSDGTVLSAAELSADINGTGYLGGLRTTDVYVWLEGLQADSDFTFSFVYRNADGSEVARDEVHMTLADWTLRDIDGDEVVAVTPIATELLQYVANNADAYEQAAISTSSFSVRLDGLSADESMNLRMVSDWHVTDEADDELLTDGGSSVSAGSFALYSSDATDEALDATTKSLLRAAFNLGVVHNPKATIELKGFWDQQKRVVFKAPNLQVEIPRDVVKVGDQIRVIVNVDNPDPALKYTIGLPGAVNDAIVGTTATFDVPVTSTGLKSIFVIAKIQEANGAVLGGFYAEAAAVAVPANTSEEGIKWSRKAWALLRPTDDIVPNYPSLPAPSLSTVDLLALNNRISASYAHFYNLKPDIYKWAGLAAHTSSGVGGQALATSGFLDQAGNSFARLTGFQPPVIFNHLYKASVRLNFAIFWDTIPHHIAFEEGALPAVERMVADGLALQDQVDAWRLIQQGIDAGVAGDPATKSQKIWAGTLKYTDVGQNITAQQIYDQAPTKELFGVLTNDNWFKTQLKSSVPGDNGTFGAVVPTGVNGGPANVAVKEDRWKWLTAPNVGVLDKWKAWSETHNNIPAADITIDGIETKAIVQNLPRIDDIMHLLTWRPAGN